MKAKCSFCEINELSDRLIRSDNLMVSFLSNPRLLPGHSLIIPRRHIEPPESLTEKELSAVFVEQDRLSKIMLGTFDGVDLWQKTRPLVLENRIKRHHLHFHLIPSKRGETIYEKALTWSVDKFTSLSQTERSAMIDLLR